MGCLQLNTLKSSRKQTAELHGDTAVHKTHETEEMLQPRPCAQKHIPKKQKLAFSFHCYIMCHSLQSLLEGIQCGLEGLKYFA